MLAKSTFPAAHLSGISAILALCLVMQVGSHSAYAETPNIIPSSPEGGADANTINNLRDAILAAYKDNPRLLAERATLRATDERYVQSRAAYGPTLSLQARYGYAHDRIEDFLDNAATYKGYSGTAQAVLSQPIYTSGRRRAAVNAAMAQVELGREALRFTEVETIQNVISAYVGVLLDRSLLEIADDNLSILKRQREESAIRYRVREITATDYEQVLSQAELARARVETFYGSRRTSEGQFLRIIGALPGDLAALPPLPELPGTIEEAYAKAESDNPLLLAARARERVSRAQLERAKAEMRGSLSLQGEASYGPVTVYDNSRTQVLTRTQLVLEVPIYSSGLRDARVREAKELNDADWRLADQALRDARQQISENWHQLKATRESIDPLKESVAAAQRAFEGAELQQKAGDRSTQDVLDLARDLLNARANLATALAGDYRAATGLLAAMGQLELANVLPDAPRYNPKAHFTKVRYRGDTPPFSHLFSLMDSVQVRSSKTDRLPRDPAADVKQSGD